jgi:hypothetical protein
MFNNNNLLHTYFSYNIIFIFIIACKFEEAKIKYSKRVFVSAILLADSYNKQQQQISNKNHYKSLIKVNPLQMHINSIEDNEVKEIENNIINKCQSNKIMIKFVRNQEI